MNVGQRRSGYVRRGLAVLGLLSFLGLGVWFARGFLGSPLGPTTELQGAGLRIRVASRPGVVRTGRNELRFDVNDLSGAPVDDAEITLRDVMTMPGTADMVGQAHAERTDPGRYRAEVNLEMSGTWRLSVDVKRPKGEALHAEGSLTTGGAGVRLTAGGEGAPGDAISHYTCPMHPSVHESQPGKCPICGMDLVPVSKEDAASGAVRIDYARRANASGSAVRLWSA